MTRTCIDCGKGISRYSKSGKCVTCFYKDDRRDAIIALYKDGESFSVIGAKYGLTKQAVYAMLQRAKKLPPKRAADAEGADRFHRRAAAAGSARLLEAYRRLAGGLPSLSLGGRPRESEETLRRLDALSRTRALSLKESLELERAIKEEDKYSKLSRAPAHTLAGGSPL